MDNIEVELIENDTIVFQKWTGLLTYENGLELTHLTSEAVAKSKDPDKVRILVDVTEAGKMEPKARKYMINNTKRPNLHKLAIYKSKAYVRATVNFVSIITGKKNLKLFPDRESAVKWLKE